MLGFSTAQANVAYTVKFQGLPAGEPLKLVKGVSDLVNLRDRPPETVSALRRRADSDLAPIIQVLHGLGYYDSLITIDLTEKRSTTTVTIQIELGPIYRIGEFRIESLENHPDGEKLLTGSPLQPDPDLGLDQIQLSTLGLRLGDPAHSKHIVEAQESLLSNLAQRGYPLGQIPQTEYTVDQQQKTLSVVVYINSGPRVEFGDTSITGLKTVDEEVVRRRILWEDGALYNPSLVRKTREGLSKTRLFSSVAISSAALPDDNLQLPMDIQVTEAKHRSIGAGVSYNTDVGPGVTAEWEHRNMRGMGERLAFRLDLEAKDQIARTTYRMPDFGRFDQALLFLAQYQQQTTDNFSERSLEGSATVERKVTENLTASLGLGIKHIVVSDSDNNSNPTLLSVPAKVRWTTTDDILDPTEGLTLWVRLLPQASLPTGDLTYLKHITTLTFYHPFGENRWIVVAAKSTLGTIHGATRVDIPPPDRFYAGSESLLRGYERLTVSPLDSSNKPIGGRSLLVHNIEVRVRTGENIGWVLFFEIGNVYENSIPNFSGRALKSAGVGFRYHTPVGPLRLDVAFPLDRRQGVDQAWEMYLNVGQAF